MIFKKLVLLTIFVLLHSAAWAIPPIPEIPAFTSIQSNGKTYHVDKDTGNNTTGNGSSSSPWATIQHGVNRLSAGDTLIVHEGNTAYSFAESLAVTISGTSENWITIRGADGETVKIESSGGAAGFDLKGTAKYIYMKNLKIANFPKCIRLRSGSQHIVLDDIELDGHDTGSGGYGLHLGALENDSVGVKHCYFRNLDIHHHSTYGVAMRLSTEDIIFDNCVAHDNGGDGFAGISNPWESYHLKDVHFVDCEAHNNAGDGFDIGIRYGSNIFKNCISRDNGGVQGNGFKVWGTDVWLINCVAYDNNYTGIDIKNYWPANVYVLNCTLVNNYNNKGSEIITEMSSKAGNGQRYNMADVDLYLYNNIFMNNKRAVESYHTNAEIKESNNNYFLSSTNATAFQFRDNLSTYKTYSLSDIGAGKAWYTDTGKGSNSFSRNTASDGLADPGFTNLANDDYTLKNSSFAVDAGTDVSVTDDIIGTQRPQGAKVDIGAFEYQVMEVAIGTPKNFRVVVK